MKQAKDKEALVALLRAGVAGWNAWRKDNPEEYIDLQWVDLSGVNLGGADLTGVNFEGAVGLDD